MRVQFPESIEKIACPHYKLIAEYEYLQLFGYLLGRQEVAAVVGAVRALDGAPKCRGRSTNPIARLRRNYIDAIRYSIIEEIRDQQRHFRSERKKLCSLTSPAAREALHRVEKILRLIGNSLETACAFACRVLENSLAGGCRSARRRKAITPEAMKASWSRARNRKDDSYPALFTLSSGMCAALGLDVDRGSGKIFENLLA